MSCCTMLVMMHVTYIIAVHLSMCSGPSAGLIVEWVSAVGNTWMGLDSTDRDEAGQHGGGVQRGPAAPQDV